MCIYYIALSNSWEKVWSNRVGVILLYRRYYRVLGAKTLLRLNRAIERPKKGTNNVKMAPHIIILSYNLEYFTVVEITGCQNFRIAPKS
jgi:hypothetical protein